MAFYSNTSLLLIILSLSGVHGHPLVALDIGKRDGYDSGGLKVDVKAHKDGDEMFYRHILPKPIHLSEITLNGQYLYTDPLPFRNEPVYSSIVYWRNDKPYLLSLKFIQYQLFLWNNGNGRLVHQAATYKEEFGNFLDNPLTIDISQNKSYVIDGKVVKFNTLKDKLPGYMVYRHTYDEPFLLKNVLDGKNNTRISVKEEVIDVYVYKWNNVPLLVDVEIFNGKRLSFAYLEKKWKAVKSPKNDDYKRMHYLRELLGYINCTMGNRAVIDLSERNDKRKITYLGKETCKFLDFKEVDSTSVTVEFIAYKAMDMKGYIEFIYKVRNGAPFDIKHIVDGKENVIIQLPNKPVKSVSLYHRKSPTFILVHTDAYDYYIEVGKNRFHHCFSSVRKFGDEIYGTMLSYQKLTKKLDV